MKKLIIATVVSLGVVSSVWAADSGMSAMDMSQHQQAAMAHGAMNNASAEAHQQMAEMHQSMMGAKAQATTGNQEQFSTMNEHKQAAIAHEFTNNGQSDPHQKVAEKHLQMMQENTEVKASEVTASDTAKPFTKMNEHERAAVAHETMNNGQSYQHEQLAEKHRNMEQSD